MDPATSFFFVELVGIRKILNLREIEVVFFF